MYDKYFFLHVPKAAGTSLFKVFDEILGSENVNQVESINKGPKQLDILNKYKLIGGHFTYFDYLKFINDERYSITFLRNPIDRFLSQYYYFKNNVGDIKQPSVVNAKKMDLKSYIEYYSHEQIYGDVLNRQVWHFVGLQKPTITENQILEIAKENLSKMNFVGIHESINDAIDLLCYDCNWPVLNNIPIVNVTNKKATYDDIDNYTLDRIKELNFLDFELYNYGIKLFNDKKRQILQQAVKINYEIFHSDSNEVLNLKTNIITRETQELNKDNKNAYIKNEMNSDVNRKFNEIEIVSARVYNKTDGSIVIKSGGEAFIEIIFKSNVVVENVVIGFVIEDEYGQKIYGTNSLLLNQIVSVREDENYCVIYRLNMNIAQGRYKLNVALHSDKCYSLSSALEDNFHSFLDLHLNECYDTCNNITDFIISEIEGIVFEGVAKLEPSFSITPITKFYLPKFGEGRSWLLSIDEFIKINDAKIDESDNSIVSSGKEGYFITGPYIDINKGKYNISFTYDMECKNETDLGFFDISEDAGNSVIAKQQIDCKKNEVIFKDVVFHFSKNVEFRVYANKNCHIKVKRINIERLE